MLGKKKGIRQIAFFMLLAGIKTVYAGAWHAGLEVQQVNLTFTPTYINTLDGFNTGFTRNASGQGIAAAVDYEIELYKALLLAIQVQGSYDNAIWSSHPDGGSAYSSDIAWRYGISFLPEFRLNKKYVIFAELGIEEGLAKQDRDSELLGTFRNAQWIIGGAIGAGVRYEVNERLGLFLGYRFTQFQNYEFYVKSADNSISQTIKDRPYSSVTSLGFSMRI